MKTVLGGVLLPTLHFAADLFGLLSYNFLNKIENKIYVAIKQSMKKDFCVFVQANLNGKFLNFSQNQNNAYGKTLYMFGIYRKYAELRPPKCVVASSSGKH